MILIFALGVCVVISVVCYIQRLAMPMCNVYRWCEFLLFDKGED